MDVNKITEGFKQVRDSHYKIGKEELLNILDNLYSSKVTITSSCRECDNYFNKRCYKKNLLVPDADKVAPFCNKKSVKDLIEVVEEIKKEHYIRAHFRR